MKHIDGPLLKLWNVDAVLLYNTTLLNGMVIGDFKIYFITNKTLLYGVVIGDFKILRWHQYMVR